jgi:hypothetical protein
MSLAFEFAATIPCGKLVTFTNGGVGTLTENIEYQLVAE